MITTYLPLKTEEVIKLLNDSKNIFITGWLTPKAKKELIIKGYYVDIISGRINKIRKKRQNEI